MFGLIDCNNFYASCERVFQPKLKKAIIVILSNNDGCVIAMSNEAKALGIKMGTPAFQMEELIIKHDIKVFSSNYTLYNDLSWRVMDAITELAPLIEIYSIDEAFISLHELTSWDLEKYAIDVRSKIMQWTKIPVSIGIAPTKTLSKMANKIAKKRKDDPLGVFVINTEAKRIEALKTFPISDVWGIGRQYTNRLLSMGVDTAYKFTTLPDAWVKKNMSVVGLRMLHELRGIPTLPMLQPRDSKQAICTSRSFGRMIEDLSTLSEAVASHAMSCARKLRYQKSCAGLITVFIHTNYYREDLPQYGKSFVFKMPLPTNFSTEIVDTALRGLQAIYRPGFQYKKAGVIVSSIIPENQVQTNLFDRFDREKLFKVNKAIDSLNTMFGKDVVRVAAQGFQKRWKLKQEMLSPCYTTRWSDIPVIKC